MNTILKLSMAAALLLAGTSDVAAQWGKKVVGNGNVTTNTVSTGSYDAIKVIGSMDVHLERGSEGNIRVQTDENLQEYVIVEVEGQTLKIRTKKNMYLKSKKGIHVYVPFQDISDVSLTGSGDVDSEDVIEATNLDVSITGSGDVDLEVKANSLDARITGSGDVVLSGSTNSLDVVVSGSGDFDGDDLSSNDTEVTVSGSGDVDVVANDSLKARVSGSGSINYSGNPEKRDTKTSGSGTISAN